jgi:methionine sulfoxide reductase heme-binding subunit
MKKFWLSPWTRALVFLLCLVPFFDLVWRFQHHQLTINPIEYITHRTGDWALRFLLITLGITPLRMILNQPQLIRFRRMTGLFAFFYACLHFTTWFYLDKSLDMREMWEDIIKRRFITMGMFALLVMLPLAITSTAGWVRRLGFRKWQLLQRGIYLSALAGVIHYYWGVKSDIRLPVLYAFILGLLLAWRIVAALRPKPAAAARSSVRATPPLRPPADARE